jgi:hypothetical protein
MLSTETTAVAQTPQRDEAALLNRPALQWKTMREAAKRIGGVVGERQLRRAATAGALKAIRINQRGDWRTLDGWVDEWLLGMQSR